MCSPVPCPLSSYLWMWIGGGAFFFHPRKEKRFAEGQARGLFPRPEY